MANKPKLDQVEEPATKGKSRRAKPYPAYGLKETLSIATAIAEQNACKPFSRLSIAEALERSPESSAFRQLITSSSLYGLTEGGYQAPKLALTPLGLSIVAPKSPSERRENLVRAGQNVELYLKLYQHFDQHKIPQKDHFKNTLIRDFDVDADDADRCIRLFIDDGRFVGLIRQVAGSDRVSIHDAVDADGPEVAPMPDPLDDHEEEKQKQDSHEDSRDRADASKVVPIKPREAATKPLRIFLSHGKDRNVLDQVKTMLDLAGLEYEIAVETETTAIPVPEKILSAMHKCSAAVICVGAHPTLKREDGSFSINENVLIEIGAAFVLYDKRVILLWDRRIGVPSNLQGLYRCEFEGSELSWSEGMRLMRALGEFKKVPIALT
jgi:hypothetical protein